jgi:hypothetical protein
MSGRCMQVCTGLVHPTCEHWTSRFSMLSKQVCKLLRVKNIHILVSKTKASEGNVSVLKRVDT